MFIGIDMGGTKTRIASSESLDKAIIQNSEVFLNTGDYQADYFSIVQIVSKLADGVEGIGIGMPGTISKDRTTVISNNHNKDWINKPFVENLSTKFNCPVYVVNDAEAAALGIAYYGEGKGLNFSYITWGTGIGGAMVNTENSLVSVSKFMWDEYFKSWEDKCGGRKIETIYGKTGDKLTESEWEKVMNDFYSELELFISKTETNYIIFGGGIAVKQKGRILSGWKGSTNLIISNLKEDVGLLGALGVIRNDLSNQL